MSCLRVQKFFRKVLKWSCVLGLFEVFRISGAVLEGLPEDFCLCLVEETAGGEDDLELQMKVAVGHGVFVIWHAQFPYGFEFLVLQDFSGSSGDEVVLAVEVVDGGGDSRECFQQTDFLVMDEVCSSSFKDCMGEEIDPHVYITSQGSRVLITLPIEDVVMGVRDALFDGHLYNLLSLLHTLSLTALALVLLFHDDSHLVALLAGSLHLCVHSWSQLSHLEDNASSLAVGTGFGISPTLPFAVSANTYAGDLDLLHLTTEDLIQSDVYFDQFRLGLLGTLILLGEEVEGTATSPWRSSVFHSFLTVLIIQLSLLWVQEGIIGFLELFELMGVSALIGVFLECAFAEGLLDLFRGGVLGDLQQFVVDGRVDLHLARSLGSLFLGLLSLVLPLVVLFAPVEEHTTIRINDISQLVQIELS